MLTNGGVERQAEATSLGTQNMSRFQFYLDSGGERDNCIHISGQPLCASKTTFINEQMNEENSFKLRSCSVLGVLKLLLEKCIYR